jgi:hypothetical protein
MLHFARISSMKENLPGSKQNEKTLLEELNSLAESANPAIRPIIPLIYRNAHQAGLRDQLHPKVQKLLRDNTLRLIATDMQNQQWLSKHLAIFQKENIPIILLKGMAFARSIYPENAPRLGVDIDFLVKNDDFESACILLTKTMNPVLLDSKRVATHDTLFERVFLPKNGNSPTVEIHRGLTNPSIFTINEQRLWSDSRQHPAYTSELVRILSPEDTLLHLAVHAFRDLDFCTHNLLDAHEVWCQWKPDLEKLMERAKYWGARKVLFYLLANCREIMETPIPDTVLESLKPASIINRINKTILQSTALHGSAHNSLCYRLIQLTSQITFPDHILRGLKFQLSYARTRMHDWIIQR